MVAWWNAFQHQTPFAVSVLGVIIAGQLGGVTAAMTVNLVSVATASWLTTHSTPPRFVEPAILFVLGTAAAYFADIPFRDRRALAHANRELEVERGRLRSAIQQLPAGVLMVDARSGHLAFANKAAENLLTYAADEGQDRLAWFETRALHADGRSYPQGSHPLARAIRLGETTTGEELHYPTHDGGSRILSVDAAPIRDDDLDIRAGLVVFTDVTDRRQLEERLGQAQRLESLGRLAGGVAHDFNNILTAMLGHAELLRQDPHDVAGHAADIARCAERAASLTHQLLAFGRQQVLRPKVTDVNEVVRGVIPMLTRIVGEHVRIASRLSAGQVTVRVDAGQLEQVVANLVVNAADAMPKGGTVTIETSLTDFRDPSPGRQSPGRSVLLAVSDTGLGMDRETRARMFEPFFTTKGLGRGTGLGLATVYGIVQQSGGTIWFYSELYLGSTFKVYLPNVDEVAHPVTRAPEPALAVKGDETILLVDDDDDVRQVAAAALRSAGYRVVACHGAQDAMTRAASVQGPIHLLVTDVVLADTHGPALFQAMSARDPHLPILYISGYSPAMVVRHGVPDDGGSFLQKPFTPDSLVRAVQRVLAGAPETR